MDDAEVWEELSAAHSRLRDAHNTYVSVYLSIAPDGRSAIGRRRMRADARNES